MEADINSNLYRVEIRRYTAFEDDTDDFECDSALVAHRFVEKQSQHGPFRAWVNGVEVKRAYHGLSLDDFLLAVDARLAAADEAWGRFVTNPATYAARGTPL